MYYTVNDPDKVDVWGDYGSTLRNGYASREKDSMALSLSRTGPFTPPIFFPLFRNEVIVAGNLKDRLSSSDLQGVGVYCEGRIHKNRSGPLGKVGYAIKPFRSTDPVNWRAWRLY